MRKIRCIIVEDEPLAAGLLADYVAQVPQLELKQTFRHAAGAAAWLLNESVDLIFLDLHLPGLKGFQFLRTLANPPMIIVTTAYHQYAVEGFELNLTDYLLKPFSFERFAAAVQKAVRQFQLTDTESQKEQTALYLTIDRKKVRIEFDSIYYVESQREYVNVVTNNGNFVSKISTTEIDSILPKSRFRRIHRSYIVAITKIDSYTKRQVQIKDKIIRIGKGYYSESEF